MREINITELRKHLPSYLRRVAAGEEIRVSSRGRVIARIVPEEKSAAAARRRLEDLRGAMIIGDIVGTLAGDPWTADEDHL
jgi:prevent-host-death family protein